MTAVADGDAVGAWFAVTSFSGRSGTWRIVTAGDNPDGVRQAAIQLLAGPAMAVPSSDSSLLDVPSQQQIFHLLVVLKSRAAGLVGYAGIRRYLNNTVTGDLP